MQNVIMFPLYLPRRRGGFRAPRETRQDSSPTHTTTHAPASYLGEHQPGDLQTSAASRLQFCSINCRFGIYVQECTFLKTRNKLQQPFLFLRADPPTHLVKP